MNTIIITAISCSALWVLVFKLYRDLELDDFRQKVFALRDEMFDFAAKEGISFDHPAYGQLRQLMNGVSRYAHRLTLFRVFLVSISAKPAEGSHFSRELEKQLNCLPDETRNTMNSYHDRLMTLIASHLIKQSPLFSPMLVILFIPLLSAYFAKHVMIRLLPKLKPLAQSVEAEILDDAAAATA